jgi:hypothetical protein
LDLVVLLNDDMTRSLARDGLTVSRTHLLWELEQRGPSTQRVLADAMKVSARTVTSLVDALSATGFVTREAHRRAHRRPRPAPPARPGGGARRGRAGGTAGLVTAAADRRSRRGVVAGALRRAGTFEAALWRSLVRWTLRGPLAVQPADEAFGYAGAVAPLFGVFVGLSAVEIPILHLILPWPTARVISLIIGGYG